MNLFPQQEICCDESFPTSIWSSHLVSHLSVISYCDITVLWSSFLRIYIEEFCYYLLFILLSVLFLDTVGLGLAHCILIAGLSGEILRVHAQHYELISCFPLLTELQNFLSIYFIIRSVIKKLATL
jgi:hypothetical protein